MNLNNRLENVAVLGAAGKMGSGIVLLLAQEMAKLKVKHPDVDYHLYAVDINERALDGLMEFIRIQSVKAAEKACVMLRGLYSERADLVENFDIIEQYKKDVLSVLRPTTEIASVRNSRMVFEAIVEDMEIKEAVLKQVNAICPDTTYYFTNTSSIPIHIIDRRVGLNGRIIGFHFYNPPAVQKLAELIAAGGAKQDVIDISHEIGKRLKKKIIPSNDIAGFIGNGHFMRDILHAAGEVRRLQEEFSLTEAIYVMNQISQDFLIRPMGIFQLIDYVGVDVCQLIMNVMSTYIEDETFESPLINRMVELEILGGQHADGSQKNGFLKYEKNRPVGVFNPESVSYDDLNFSDRVDTKLGPLPEGFYPWRSLLMDPGKADKLTRYFDHLKSMNTLGAQLARRYFFQSAEIARGLVAKGVAGSIDDVNGVLMNGFYHLYGPVNTFMQEKEAD